MPCFFCSTFIIDVVGKVMKHFSHGHPMICHDVLGSIDADVMKLNVNKDGDVAAGDVAQMITTGVAVVYDIQKSKCQSSYP